MTVTLMVYEIIGKVVLYIIGTLLFGVFADSFDSIENDYGMFVGAWIASIIVFLWMILP